MLDQLKGRVHPELIAETPLCLEFFIYLFFFFTFGSCQGSYSSWEDCEGILNQQIHERAESAVLMLRAE